MKPAKQKPSATAPLSIACHLYALRRSVCLFLGTPDELRRDLAEHGYTLSREQEEEANAIAAPDSLYSATVLRVGEDVVIYAPHGIAQAELVHECVHAADALLDITGIEGSEARAYLTEYLFTSFSSDYGSQLPLSLDAASPRKRGYTAPSLRRARAGLLRFSFQPCRITSFRNNLTKPLNEGQIHE